MVQLSLTLQALERVLAAKGLYKLVSKVDLAPIVAALVVRMCRVVPVPLRAASPTPPLFRRATAR